MEEFIPKYNPDCNFSSECKLTMVDLEHEIQKEFELYLNEQMPKASCEEVDKLQRNPESYHDKFKNYDRSGLIDKLNDNLKFDIETIAGNSKYEKFNMLKLLKILYRIEKDGYYLHEKKPILESKVPILDILSTPSLANIYTDYSDTTKYGEVFKYLIDNIRLSINDAKKREEIIYSIDTDWNLVLDKVLLFALSDDALRFPDYVSKELENIDSYLDNMILKKFDQFNPTSLKITEGVMETFFNILLSHMVLCENADEIKLNYDITICNPPSKEYTIQYKKHEDDILELSIINEIKKNLTKNNVKGNMSKSAKFVLDMINTTNLTVETDLKHYKYALDKVSILNNWYREYKPLYKKIISHDKISFSYLVVFIQEIAYCKKNNESVLNNYYGYKNKYKTLISGLKKEMKTDSIVIKAWDKRLQNRNAINLGMSKAIQQAREIEIKMLKIKEIIYSYRNIKDLEDVNKYLLTNISSAITNNSIAIQQADIFNEYLHSKLKGKAKNISEFRLYRKSRNITKFFKFLFFADKHYTFDIADIIANQVNEYYLSDNSDSGIITTNFSIVVSEYFKYEGIIQYYVDIRQKCFLYLFSYPVSSDENIERLQKLGLQNFVMTTEEEVNNFKEWLLK